MYQALYRKWRPQTFDEVVGQKHITQTLKNQVKTGRLSHAYIFIGTRGTGKTTCARILAKAVNCEHPVDGNPCGVCPACRGISEGSVLDVVELDAASNNSVDNVRALREEAVFSPATVKKRVYIVDEVHMLSTAAFNALLKILEEPPEHLMFILATTELQKAPAMILSRCQRHSFKRIDAPAIAEYLEYIAGKEGFTLHHDAAELIARLADGGVRDALSLLDQCSASEEIDVDAVYNTMGLAGNRRVAEMLERILRHDSEGALRAFSGMWMDGKNPSVLLTELNTLLRDVLMLHVAPKGALDLLSGGYDVSTLQSFSRRLTAEEILCAMQTVQQTLDRLRDASNPKMQVELCLISLCEDVAGDSFASLRARISRLEEDVARGAALPRSQPREEAEELDEPGCGTPFEEAPDMADDDTERGSEFSEASYSEPASQNAPPEASPAPDIRFQDVLNAVKPTLPLGLRFIVDDPTKLRGSLEGDALRLEALPPFVYDRLKKQDILQLFSVQARQLLGRELRVQLCEMKPDQHETRDLEELRKYPEVRFTDK